MTGAGGRHDDLVTLQLPRQAAGQLERIIQAGLIRLSRVDGGRPTPEADRIMRQLHAAAHGRRFAPEPPPTPPAKVDHGLRNVFAAGEAADVLGCTAKHVRSLCRDGAFPNAWRVSLTGPWMIPADDLHAFREKRWREASGQSGPTPREAAGDGR
ncbi:helix-turn-helix domain-containing protein [Streptomyces sp. NPDC101225]|uniref:helix-turn-helix domain-containing protein n=1 Tax=Streptomyces sp. NPDC101225 TaxID=3366135 RepID=UPI0037F40979